MLVKLLVGTAIVAPHVTFLYSVRESQPEPNSTHIC